MSKIIKIHQIIINPRENGLSIKNCANNIAIYHNCGHGSHGKIEPAIAVTHKIIQIIQHAISIYLFTTINIIRVSNCQNITV